MEELATDRLILRPSTVADVEELFRLVSGPDRDEITRFLRWDGPDSYDEFREFMLREQTFEDSGLRWAIVDADGEITGTAYQAIGHIGSRPILTGRGDVGYWLGRPYWGQGIMTEALTAVRDYSFRAIGLHKLEAEVFVDNQAGIRLLESVGFTREGTIRSCMQKRGEWIDAHAYGLLRSEWDVAFAE